MDPSGTASSDVGLFGIESTRDSARVVITPVPWDVTTSYQAGTARGPAAILKASPQIDLFDLELGEAYKAGYHLLPIPAHLMTLNDKLKPLARSVRAALEHGDDLTPELKQVRREVNAGCAVMTEWVFKQAQSTLALGQIPAVLGGDHSTPEGNIRAVGEALKGEYGILHIDAHADLREQYQGFERSHASIMNNVMRSDWAPKKLVQVSIRDFCQEEYQLISRDSRIETFFDLNLKRALFEGETWASICHRIIDSLPAQVYVSVDIDGLSPEYCPHTGTPVPGGINFDQLNYLLRSLVQAKRKIVGFDLNEVAPGAEPDEWDGNVGSRVLYKLCGWSVLS